MIFPASLSPSIYRPNSENLEQTAICGQGADASPLGGAEWEPAYVKCYFHKDFCPPQPANLPLRGPDQLIRLAVRPAHAAIQPRIPPFAAQGLGWPGADVNL